MDRQLFLVPYDQPNFKWTVVGPDAEEGPALTADELSKVGIDLDNDTQPIRIWGVRPGQGNDSKYEILQPDDYLLFYNTKKYRWVGVVDGKFQTDGFDDEYWVDGTNCRNLYSVKRLEQIDLSREALNDTFDYETKGDNPWYPQGLQRVAPEKLDAALSGYDSLDNLVDEMVENAQQDAWWE